MTSNEEIDSLIENSSLGTPGAKELRSRTTDAEVADILRRVDEKDRRATRNQKEG